MTEGLTDRQSEILNFIWSMIQSRHYPPSIQEIADYVGLKSTHTAWTHVRALARKGYIEVGQGPRMITVLKQAS